MLTGPMQSVGGVLKGVLDPSRAGVPEALRRLKAGEFKSWEKRRGLPPIILGSRLARSIGMRVDDIVRIMSPQGEMWPSGPRFLQHRFRVAAIFESGFFDLDSTWAFASLADVQRVMSVGDVVNAIEIRVDDIYRAPDVAALAGQALGPGFVATTWMEDNQQLLGALRMERVVTVITIGLIQMVAALNILISLVMMVMEKHRDIAILMSMGARKQQISRLFQLQGVLIGAVGTVIGLLAGYTLCYFADRGRWVRLDEAIYSLSFVPFEPRWLDGIWISAAALLISFLATIYPARSAARIAPAEALRYE
jgi:lipoprotein-releasing system permease protein